MSVRFSIVLSGLLLSLAAIPASFAQNPLETSGSATGGTVAPAPAKEAPAAPGAQSAGNAESEALLETTGRGPVLVRERLELGGGERARGVLQRALLGRDQGSRPVPRPGDRGRGWVRSRWRRRPGR